MDGIPQALAHPIRRDILRMVGDRGLTARAIAGAFAVRRRVRGPVITSTEQTKKETA